MEIVLIKRTLDKVEMQCDKAMKWQSGREDDITDIMSKMLDFESAEMKMVKVENSN